MLQYKLYEGAICFIQKTDRQYFYSILSVLYGQVSSWFCERENYLETNPVGMKICEETPGVSKEFAFITAWCEIREILKHFQKSYVCHAIMTYWYHSFPSFLLPPASLVSFNLFVCWLFIVEISSWWWASDMILLHYMIVVLLCFHFLCSNWWVVWGDPIIEGFLTRFNSAICWGDHLR